MNCTTLTAASVNPALSPRAISFYRWLHRWHSQTQEVAPSTGYFAKKQKVTERCIYNWLRQLRDAGWIRVDIEPGIARLVTPLVEPPTKPKKAQSRAAAAVKRLVSRRTRSGANAGANAGVSPYSVSDAVGTQETTTPPPNPEPQAEPPADVVASLIENGVSSTVAVRLAQNALEECRKQVKALPHRKGVQSVPAFLVRAIEQRWCLSVPPDPETRREKPKPAWSKAPVVESVNGKTGRDAFSALRDKMKLAGRVSV